MIWVEFQTKSKQIQAKLCDCATIPSEIDENPSEVEENPSKIGKSKESLEITGNEIIGFPPD